MKKEPRKGSVAWYKNARKTIDEAIYTIMTIRVGIKLARVKRTGSFIRRKTL